MSQQFDDLHAFVGSYATNTLDDDERAAFEQHLRGCESCRREVAEFTETLSQLSGLHQAPPPPAVRAAVLESIRSVRPLPPEVGGPELGAGPRRARTDAPPKPEADRRPDATVVPLRDRRRSARAGWLVAVAAALMVVALGGGVVTLQQQNSALQAGRDRAVAEIDRADTELATLMSAADLRSYPVTMADGEHGTYLVSQAQDRGVFIAASVEAPAPGQSYQLWVIRDGRPASAAVVDHGGRMKIWFDGVRGGGTLAFTLEPIGGSAQPTTMPMAGADL